MEYGLLQDIFPDWQKTMNPGPPVDQKAKKKRSKREKDPSLRFLDSDYPVDPDRQVLPPPEPEAFQNQSKAEMPELPETHELPPVPRLPKVPGTNQEYQVKRPKYFGASEDDVEDFTGVFTNVIGDDPVYTLAPSEMETEVANFRSRASATLLPPPNLNDAWKPLTPSTATTAFFKQENVSRAMPSEASDLTKKMDEIFARLDRLERERKESSQTEVLLFVGSGLGLILVLDLLTRK
jgi:hypothetical protein